MSSTHKGERTAKDSEKSWDTSIDSEVARMEMVDPLGDDKESEG